MTAANYTQQSEEVQRTPKPVYGTPDVPGILEFFSDRMDLTKFGAEELLFLSCAVEHASDEARSLSRIVSGIGCLIFEDQQHGSKLGMFRDADLPELLHHISRQIDVIGVMAAIGSEAESELLTRASSAETKKKEAIHG